MWVAIMDRVGGYLGYLALCEDARAYDDVMIVMRAEAQARALAEMGAK
jgi:hypothetical protein